MKRLHLLKSMLLLFALIVGSGTMWADETYKKATSISVGDIVVFVVEGYGSGDNAGKELTSISSTSTKYGIGTDYKTIPAGTMTFEVASGYSGTGVAFKNGTNYLYWTSGNSLNVNSTLSAKTSWTVTFDNGNAIILNNDDDTRQIWWNSSSPRFACYTDKKVGDAGYASIQLYKKAYTVTYDANGGTGTMTDEDSPYFSGSAVTVKSNSFTRDGYTFTGWNTKANGGGTSYAAGATFDISENTTLYAQWVSAGDYINAVPSSADIVAAGDVAEFTLSTNLADPSYAIKYYTTADGDVEASKPAWLGDVEFAGNSLDIEVNENTGAARTAYFKVYSGETYSDVFAINQAAYVAVTSVSLDITSKTLLVDGTVTLEATVNPDNASYKTVTWESDDKDVATVNSNGKVTAVAAGTATITAKSTDDPTKKATCTITVTDGSIDLDVTGEIEITSFPSFSGSGYKTANPYTIGDYDWIATNCMLGDGKLQLRKSDGVLTSPTIKSSKGITVTVTVPTNSVTVSDGTSSSSTSNGVAILTTTKTSTTITISSGALYAQVSKIKIAPTPANPSAPVDNGDNTITLTTTANMAGWRAFYDASQDYTLDENTKAYVVTAESGTADEVELTKLNVTAIPHGEAVILKTTDAGHSMTLTKTTGVATLGTNLLAVTNGTSNVDGYRLGYGNIGGEDAVGFFKYTTTTAPAAGIVYIDKSNVNISTLSRGLSISFADDETTGINTVENINGEFNNAVYYNLSGQRVANPSKGLYIVNGKKVIIK